MIGGVLCPACGLGYVNIDSDWSCGTCRAYGELLLRIAEVNGRARAEEAVDRAWEKNWDRD